MTFPDSTPTRENGKTRPPATVAERHGHGPAGAAAPLPDWLRAMPGKRPTLAAKLRPWLLAGLLGLLLGGAAVGWVAYQVMPVQATEVQRVFADVNGDGAADLIVSGWVIYAQKAAGQ